MFLGNEESKLGDNGIKFGFGFGFRSRSFIFKLNYNKSIQKYFYLMHALTSASAVDDIFELFEPPECVPLAFDTFKFSFDLFESNNPNCLKIFKC
jgi:hypothetical protein